MKKFIFFSFVLFGCQSNPIDPIAPRPSSTDSGREVTEADLATDGLLAFAEIPVSLEALAESTRMRELPESCRSYLQSLATTPLSALVKRVKAEGGLNAPVACEKTSAWSSNALQNFREGLSKCRDLRADEASPACDTEVFGYRQLWLATLLDADRLNAAPSQIAFAAAIKAALALYGTQIADSELKVALASSEELVKRFPQRLELNELSVLTWLVDDFFRLRQNQPPVEGFGRAVVRVGQVAGDKGRYFDLYLYVLNREPKNETLVRGILRDGLKENPNNASAHYWTGCLDWRAKKKAKALASFEKASRLASANEIYRETAQRAKKVAPGTPVCSLYHQMNFGRLLPLERGQESHR